MSKPRVLLISGYFDWFSGYQEVALAGWFPRYATTEVIASDRVSPMFSDAHLAGLGVARRYEPGARMENGVKMTRFPTREKRSMVWSTQARMYIESQKYDLIVQLMPGQLMPVAGTLARNHAVRAVLYGDNSAMWSHLSAVHRLMKGMAFAVSKGALYALVNARADLVYGFTPNTVSRLKFFNGGKEMSLLPLAFDPAKFYFDEGIRESRRLALGYAESDTVVLAAGKLQEKKRLDLLVQAFSRLASGYAGLKLLIVGDDDSPYSGELKAQISADPALNGLVTVLGFADTNELNALFNAADIGVWPRMPAITIQQAMGTGLKVVLPKNDLVGHLVLPGSGTYFNELDESDSTRIEMAIASQLSDGWGDTDRRQRADINAWLGADMITSALLQEAGLGR
jgi:Glycosyl transferases group 1